MSIVKWRPRSESVLHDLLDFPSTWDRLMDWSVPEVAGDERAHWHPRVDAYEEGDKMVLHADLPGLKKEDVEVNVEDGVLTLKGTRKKEKEVKEGGYYRCERVYGEFSRSFTLPEGMDASQIKASFADGVLTVTMPKSEESRKPRKTAIKID